MIHRPLSTTYGIDMADAIIQMANAGLSDAVAWMVDDAMHSADGSNDKLKIWGFWNILGEGYFGAEDEAVRPWFYAWGLMTKYMPTGCDVYDSTISGSSSVGIPQMLPSYDRFAT